MTSKVANKICKLWYSDLESDTQLAREYLLAKFPKETLSESVEFRLREGSKVKFYYLNGPLSRKITKNIRGIKGVMTFGKDFHEQLKQKVEQL